MSAEQTAAVLIVLYSLFSLLAYFFYTRGKGPDSYEIVRVLTAFILGLGGGLAGGHVIKGISGGSSGVLQGAIGGAVGVAVFVFVWDIFPRLTRWVATGEYSDGESGSAQVITRWAVVRIQTITAITAGLMVFTISFWHSRVEKLIVNRPSTAEVRLQYGLSSTERYALSNRGNYYRPLGADCARAVPECRRYEQLVDRDSVQAQFWRVQENLLERVGSLPELAAMRAYIEIAFPMPALAEVERYQTHSLTYEDAADAAWDYLIEWLARLRRRSENLTVTISLNITPVGARVMIHPYAGGDPTTGVANNRIPNIYRGLYRYRVTRPGYLGEEGLLNLVDNPGTILTCRMAADSTSSVRRPCTLIEER
jgi:hypothetical protein